MKVFCKYCRFYDPAGYVYGNIEFGESPGRLRIPAECEYGEGIEIVAVHPPMYHPENGLQTEQTQTKKAITLDSNKNFNCPFYWIKTERGAAMPVNTDGTPHWGTCPEADRFRGKEDSSQQVFEFDGGTK